MEQEKRLKGTRWQPSHAEQSWAELKTDRTYKSVSRSWGWKCNGWKKTLFGPQFMVNMQGCKPFPGHNICFYIFGSPAVLSSSLHLPAHSPTSSAALPSQVCCWSECAVQDHGCGSGRKQKNSHPLQNRYSGESNRWEKLRMSNFIIWKLYNTPKRFELLGNVLD